MRTRVSVVLVMVFGAACVPAYREDAPAGRAEAPTETGRGSTVIGHVAPDGSLVADTVAGEARDTVRVERETVLTGAIRPQSGTELATGWRVQVLATPERTLAERYAGGLDPLVGGEPVYVEWVDPWWKVRVGDFTNREAAERLRERLASQGIPEAWTVRTTIRTGP